MNFEKGMIVKPQNGHRINRHFVLVETDENFVYIADGKRRRLSNPKKKNKKHMKLLKLIKAKTLNILTMNHYLLVQVNVLKSKTKKLIL